MISIFQCFLLLKRIFVFKIGILLLIWWLIMLFNLLNYKFNYIVIYKNRTQLALNWYFLHNCNRESQINRSCYWISGGFLKFTQLFKNFDESNNYIFSIRHYILNSFQSADNYTNKTQDSMLERWLLNNEQIQNELALITRIQQKYIVSYQLIHQIFPQLRRYLKSVYSQW